MNNFCSHCGARLKENANFCSACGTKVANENFSPNPMPYEKKYNDQNFNSPMQNNSNSGLYAKFYDTFLRKDGRLNRWRYFKRVIIIHIIFSIIQAPFYSSKSVKNISSELSLFLLALFGLYTYLLYCLDLRRLHDLNDSELIAFIPIILSILIAFEINTIPMMVGAFAISMYLLFKRGTIGSNKYGEDPLADKY